MLSRHGSPFIVLPDVLADGSRSLLFLGQLVEPSDQMQRRVCTIGINVTSAGFSWLFPHSGTTSASDARASKHGQTGACAATAMMALLRTRVCRSSEFSPESALVHRKPSRVPVDARRDRRRCRCLALSPGAGVRRCDRLVGDALCARPPSRQGGARSGRRRARHPRAWRWMRTTALTKPSPARSATISASRPKRCATARASIISSCRSPS